MSLTAGAKLGPYEVVAPLGSGGMGEVYRARDTRLGREVAIKLLSADRLSDPVRRARFEQEARAVAALNHPHIVTIHEIESAENIDFIVMELVPGKTLDALIPRNGMRLGEALRIAIPLADALAAAHAAGIVHRDFKPANVMLTPEGAVKVLDFGLAKLLQGAEGGGEDDTTLDAQVSPPSRVGTVAGTPAYMSPEQASGGKVDARSDIFSFGAVLYEIVTGRRPFGGGSTAEMLASLLKEQPKPPSEVVPDVPKELERIILRCLRKEPARRFQNMLDVKVELEEIKEESDSQALAPTGPATTKRRLRRRRIAVGAAGILILGIATAATLWRLRRPELPAPSLVPLTSTPGSETQPTFSPDGDQVAFVWDGEKGDNTDIYVKMIGATEARRLTTDPATDRWPAWSPDGRQIAFVRLSTGSATGTIHVISPLGGADRKVSDQPVVGPLSWSPDGRWLATGAIWGGDPRTPPGIRFIEVATGEVRDVTSPAEPGYDIHPTFSPAGRHLAYASCLHGFTCDVDVVDIGPDDMPKGTARRLTRRIVMPRFGLAWTRDSASVVYADLIDTRLWRVRIQGDRPPERVEIAGPAASFPATAVPRDRLAFVREGTRWAICRFEPGHPPQVIATTSLPFRNWSPNVSPDGSRIAFASNRGGEADAIWLAASDGSNPIQLTHGPGLMEGSPRWSPDGRRIAFDSLGEDGVWHIWTIDADGGALRRVTSHPANHNQPAWSHDGRYLYFFSNRTGTSQTTWRIPVAGGPEEQVASTGGGRSQESADGRTLYVQRAWAGSSPLLAVPLAGGPERTLIDCVGEAGFAVSTAGVYHVGCGGDPSARPLLLLNPATGRDRLLGTLERPRGLTVPTDGKTILYTTYTGEGSDLWLIENFR